MRQGRLMILTIGGIKGGTGKTTIATNFAAIAAGRGGTVLLVDADEQESASAFSAVRSEEHPKHPQVTTVKLTGHSVRHEVERFSRKFMHIIIDTGGRDTTSQRAALSVSDCVLVPFPPRCYDVWTIGKAALLINEIWAVQKKLKAYACLNRADPPGQGTDNTDAQSIIRQASDNVLEYLDMPIGNRKAFAHAASRGLAVTELSGEAFNEKASAEITALYRRCFDVEAI